MESLAGSVVCDGSESVEGRALLLISALHHAKDALTGVPIRFVNVSDRAVVSAIELLEWDFGLDVGMVALEHGDSAVQALSGARLYAAIGFRDAKHLLGQEASRASVPSLIALQFPDMQTLDAHGTLMLAAAHDPAIYGGRLSRALI